MTESGNQGSFVTLFISDERFNGILDFFFEAAVKVEGAALRYERRGELGYTMRHIKKQPTQVFPCGCVFSLNRVTIPKLFPPPCVVAE